MDKKITLQSLLSVLFAFVCIHSYSQGVSTKEIKWDYNDTIEMPVFYETSQIVEWGKKIAPAVVRSYKYDIKNHDVFILTVYICYGRRCPFIYIFKLENKQWKLIASAFANFSNYLEIEVDDNLEEIIFKVNSNQVGKLPFDVLDLKDEVEDEWVPLPRNCITWLITSFYAFAKVGKIA